MDGTHDLRRSSFSSFTCGQNKLVPCVTLFQRIAHLLCSLLFLQEDVVDKLVLQISSETNHGIVILTVGAGNESIFRVTCLQVGSCKGSITVTTTECDNLFQ